MDGSTGISIPAISIHADLLVSLPHVALLEPVFLLSSSRLVAACSNSVGI